MKQIMKSIPLRVVLGLLFCSLLIGASLSAAEPAPKKPGPRDKCGVCGMFVAQYPAFVSQIKFKDGTVAFFEGNKDLFTYYRQLSRFNPGKKSSDIAALYVADYYSVAPVNGFKAFYVIGSDVTGPMGRELISFRRQADAKEFCRDHKGQKVLRFGEVDAGTLKGLD